MFILQLKNPQESAGISFEVLKTGMLLHQFQSTIIEYSTKSTRHSGLFLKMNKLLHLHKHFGDFAARG